MNYSLYPTRVGVRQGACPRNGRVPRSREWHEGAVLMIGLAPMRCLIRNLAALLVTHLEALR